MVFECIMTIRGCVIPVKNIVDLFDEKTKQECLQSFLDDGSFREYITDFLDSKICSFFNEGEVPKTRVKIFEKLKLAPVQYYNYACCSEQSDKIVVIGHEISELKRGDISCPDCGEYTKCDTCIGYMEDGKYYNVDAMLNEVVRADNQDETSWDEQILTFLKVIGISDISLETVLMLDDCLSCT